MIKNSKRGFTIIEVTLVLALAGLIFLMAFIALPQLQRSQRDAERKDDMMLFTEAVKKYMTNNRGTLPDGTGTFNNISDPGDPLLNPTNPWVAFWREYIGDKLQDPRDGVYSLDVRACTSGGVGTRCGEQDYSWDTTIHLFTEAECEEDHAVRHSNPRNFAVVYRTESSGVYCFASNS